jgi:hypothetical protein
MAASPSPAVAAAATSATNYRAIVTAPIGSVVRLHMVGHHMSGALASIGCRQVLLEKVKVDRRRCEAGL